LAAAQSIALVGINVGSTRQALVSLREQEALSYV
jgi:hypothetical protein